MFMATQTSPETELSLLEEEATHHLAEEAGQLGVDLDETAAHAGESEPGEAETPTSLQPAFAVSFPVIAAAIMLGGVFSGVSPRVYATVAGLLGVGLSIVASRLKKSSVASVVIAVGIFAIGALMVVPTGLDNLFNIRRVMVEAISDGNILRPPVPFVAGWQLILGWIMAVTGFQSGWVAMSMRRPSAALLVPLPVAAIAGISLPEAAQLPSGIAVLVLFAISLGLTSAAQLSAGDGTSASFSYQLLKTARGLPLVALVTVALIGLSRAGFLFPEPIINPEQEAQKPKTVPLTEAEDRVLFEVESTVVGPWRIGGLDVYDGKDWRLPPFAQSSAEKVPKSGIVDRSGKPGVSATFTMTGLGGAVLPTLPNTIGIISKGPVLAYDDRNDNIRVIEGQIEPGLSYVVTAAGLPTLDELKAIDEPVPKALGSFTEIPPPPAAVADLISQAPKSSKWEEFDFLRTYILENVVSKGSGIPKSITPDRVADMVAGSKEASPFEIVAAQAMFARWVGIPARIGYGFDGGEFVEKVLQVHPYHGAAFVEVYFPGYNWLPVIGTPKKAKASTTTGQQKVDPNVLPSDDIGVQLVFPIETPAPNVVGAQLRRILLIVVPVLLALFLAYVIWPGIKKAFVRSKRRSWARSSGPHARIAVAYADWRDTATDFGCFYPGDTPFLFRERFQPDDEHGELAWLTTRALWGDLRPNVTEELAMHCEQLSESLRRRMSLAQAPTIRALAVVSRLSLRNPYTQENNHAARS